MAPTAGLELCRQITLAIEPWKKSTQKPPFSNKELIVMALLLYAGSLTPQEIMDWVAKTFKFHRDFISSIFWNHYNSKRRTAMNLSGTHYVNEFYDALYDYEMPLQREPHRANRHSSYRLSKRDAGVFLQHAPRVKPTEIKSEDTGTGDDISPDVQSERAFPFFQLPAELRTAIYNMVLRYPQSGLRPRMDWTLGRGFVKLTTCMRDFTPTFSFDTWHSISHDLEVPSVDRILGLLLVNKQMYEEAMPCFYSINTFLFQDVYDLSKMLDWLTPVRRQHLVRIAFSYHPSDISDVHSAFKLLGSLPYLQTLCIDMDEREWMQFGWAWAGMFDASRVPGLTTLRGNKGLKEVVFTDNCPNVRAYLKSEMEEPMPEFKARQQSRKRKASAEIVSSQPTRAAKATRTD